MPKKSMPSHTKKASTARTTPAKKVSKKSAAGKPAAYRSITPARKASFPQMPEGYRKKGDIYVHADVIIEPSRLRRGFEQAKDEIVSMADEIAKSFITSEHRISEIELSVSFNAKGELLGFGIGGATSIKIKIVPSGN